MAELNSGKKEKAVFVFLTLCGLLLFTVGIAFFLMTGITRMPFHMIGSAFLSWAFAASPKVMLRSVLDKSKVNYGKLSKILLLIVVLNYIAALAIYYYRS